MIPNVDDRHLRGTGFVVGIGGTDVGIASSAGCSGLAVGMGGVPDAGCFVDVSDTALTSRRRFGAASGRMRRARAVSSVGWSEAAWRASSSVQAKAMCSREPDRKGLGLPALTIEVIASASMPAIF